MRSILYVKQMFDAVVTELKTETRRTHGLKKINECPDDWEVHKVTVDLTKRLHVTFLDYYPDLIHIKSRFKKNEILYLAEPTIETKEKIFFGYAWDFTDNYFKKELQPKGFRKLSPLLMKQDYGRHFIKIKDIHCQRLKDITADAVIREGIEPTKTDLPNELIVEEYATLFDKINGVGTWNKNPFVFVYEFELLKNYNRRS